MTRLLRFAFFASLVPLALTNCSDDPVEPSSRVVGPISRVQQSFKTYDDLLADIATVEPSFSGIFFRDLQAVVSVTDLSRSEFAKTAAASILGNPAFAEAAAERAEFRFMDLYNWAKQLRGALPVGVVSSDIDEMRNVLRFGVVNPQIADALRTVIAAASIPSSAVQIDVRPAATLAQTLQSRVRGTEGGLQVYWTVSDWCTLGFNATYYPGGMATSVYATNGHCTNPWGVVQASPHYQNRWLNSSDLIGEEIAEAVESAASQDLRCDRGFPCKWSDISLGAYNPSTQVMGYFLAETTDRVALPTLQGSLQLAANTIYVAGEDLWPTAGQNVDKIGARTGWTYGPVSQTCVDEIVSGREFICQYWADAGGGRGDSGSAIFLFAAPAAATIVGQLFAVLLLASSDFGDRLLFSPWNNIQAELGNIKVSSFMP